MLMLNNTSSRKCVDIALSMGQLNRMKNSRVAKRDATMRFGGLIEMMVDGFRVDILGIEGRLVTRTMMVGREGCIRFSAAFS